MKIIETEINVQTGKEITIERQLTAEEEAQIIASRAKSVEQSAEAEAKEAARQAILDRLGLTADEAKLLLG